MMEYGRARDVKIHKSIYDYISSQLGIHKGSEYGARSTFQCLVAYLQTKKTKRSVVPVTMLFLSL